jgi:APA family basic amino acid/polyamine antiporter
MAVVSGEAPALFLRKATGLVKGWNRFDAFVYSFLSVNLITLGFFGALSFAPFFPDGQLLPAVLITGVLVTFLVITYASLIAIMPRAGGDYVWQSRVLGGGIAFVLAVTGWWFILWHWAPIYGNILSVQLFQPIFATLKWHFAVGNSTIDAAWFGTKTGIFTVSVITIVIAGFLVSLGMEGYAKVQKYCFWGGMIGVAVMFLILLFGSKSGFQSAFNQESARLFGTSGDVYTKTITESVKFGYSPPGLKLSPFFGPTLLLIPLLVFYLLWPNWGATLYGEVRGASDFRRVRNGMFWGLWGTVILTVLFFLLVAKTMGFHFYMAANSNWANWFYAVEGAPTPVGGIWPYPPMLVGYYLHNTAFSVLFILVFSLWFFGWAGTLFLSSTRVIFAAAFDRILPEWAASVSEKRHVPFGALALMLIPSIVVSALYAYNSTFLKATLDATLVIAVTFLGSAIAAIILPWRRKTLYEGSAIARYKVGGVPLITATGLITGGFIGWLLWKWWTNDTYGINNATSRNYMLILYAMAVVVYVIAYIVRRSQGVNFKAIHAEIPVE